MNRSRNPKIVAAKQKGGTREIHTVLNLEGDLNVEGPLQAGKFDSLLHHYISESTPRSCWSHIAFRLENICLKNIPQLFMEHLCKIC